MKYGFSDYMSYLIDVLGYASDDVLEMTKQEVERIIRPRWHEFVKYSGVGNV